MTSSIQPEPATGSLVAIDIADNGLAGIVVEPTDDLLRLQQKFIDAVAPLTVATATSAALFTTPAEPDIHAGVIEYIAAFVPDHSGKNFMPHVTIGVGLKEYLDAMVAAPFDFGTARKNLKTLELKA